MAERKHCNKPTLMGTETEEDVDNGKDQDIFDINEALGLDLFEGDIQIDDAQERNSLIGDEYRWPKTIPYYLEDSLDINAKGVILKAFEQYRLKSCIDFKPWTGEANYISVIKASGCWSKVGNRHMGRQELSIGANCEKIATIEHEFLHALGFWHEQSRSDRDDYVTIMWDRISEGREHNFNKYSDKVSDSLNAPYDYTSMMHYSKNAFRNGTEPTIITKIPEFSNVIGQRMEFSDTDLQKLNRLYNCTSSLSFMDTCSFEFNNICGMIQGSSDTADWQHVLQVPAGPNTDHTNMGNCEASGHFMHFSTSAGTVGSNAILESRILYPKRGFQCLQFYYYNSRSENDVLNILIREYDGSNSNGSLKHVGQIKGNVVDYWQLHHFSLNVTNKFRVVFEGKKGAGTSGGGLSIDDINLSETQCPGHIWHIRNFTQLLNTSSSGTDGKIYSPRFQSSEGYEFQIGLYINGTGENPSALAIYFYLTSGKNDDQLQWPCPWKQVTMMLMDQHPDIRHRMSHQRSVTTNPTELQSNENNYLWDRPDKVGKLVNDSDGTQFYRGPGRGTSSFLTHDRLESREFIKGNDVYFLLTLEDVSHLVNSQPIFTTTTTTTTATTTTTTTPLPAVTTEPITDQCKDHKCENNGVCVIEKNKPVCRCQVGEDWWFMGERCEKKGKSEDTIIIAVSSCVAVFTVMLVITIVSTYCVKQKYRRKSEDTVIQNMHTIDYQSLSLARHPQHWSFDPYSSSNYIPMTWKRKDALMSWSVFARY
ncbi:LOW QUALITY PROTEIN: meprin A subunit beta [Latimeria chalumnae]|uniref:LOW QUALITY PROTEIN: meprin A subunit beta n=1 Tax=Latimeria chalumnae TaxID=7897 RepID=UPI00313AEF31